jgi:mRNA interferase YafQ
MPVFLIQKCYLMTSKKTAASKRTILPRTSDYTKSFLKDWERLSRSGRYDMNRLKEAMLLLIANEKPLGQEWLDHPLKGNWSEYRECHIGGDFLLIYQASERVINFVRAGTHAELFND